MRLLPKKDGFQKLFLAFAALLEKAAADFNQTIQGGGDLAAMAERMHLYEQEADTLGLSLFTMLHKSFVTPHDPEDLYALIHNLDDVMDGIEDIAHRAVAYRLKAVPDVMRKMAALVYEAVKQIAPALDALDKNVDVIASCLMLKNREAEMNVLTRQAIARLFAEEGDAMSLLKQKEIFEFFEVTADACAHVATIIGRIHIKGG